MERLTSIEELLQLTEEVVSNRKDHRDKVMAKVHRFYPLPSTSENHASNRAKANSQPELEPRKLPKKRYYQEEPARELQSVRRVQKIANRAFRLELQIALRMEEPTKTDQVCANPPFGMKLLQCMLDRL